MTASGLLLTPLPRIPGPRGEVRHALRANDPGFAGFGEVYFSEVLPGATKGWKRHRLMTMNLVVVSGSVRFVVHDGDRALADCVLSAEQDGCYGRLTVPPSVWMAFQGLGSASNLVMNLADRPHDPEEAECRDLESFPAALLRG
jgi:dTDP-4-dehydrorhamnose 3,5-epimerase